MFFSFKFSWKLLATNTMHCTARTCFSALGTKNIQCGVHVFSQSFLGAHQYQTTPKLWHQVLHVLRAISFPPYQKLKVSGGKQLATSTSQDRRFYNCTWLQTKLEFLWAFPKLPSPLWEAATRRTGTELVAIDIGLSKKCSLVYRPRRVMCVTENLEWIRNTCLTKTPMRCNGTAETSSL